MHQRLALRLGRSRRAAPRPPRRSSGLIADEVVALLARRGVEQVVDQLVRIGALRPPDHVPHRDVPLVAIVPDDVGHLRPRQSAHLHLEAELAPFLRDQLRGLEFLRVGRLGSRDNDYLPDLVAGGFRRRVNRCGERAGRNCGEHRAAKKLTGKQRHHDCLPIAHAGQLPTSLSQIAARRKPPRCRARVRGASKIGALCRAGAHCSVSNSR